MKTGNQTPEGFIPGFPGANDIFSQILQGKKSGWDGVNETPAGNEIADARLRANADLKRCYVQVFSSPAGKQVIEHLLDQTLRRGSSHLFLFHL